MIDVIEISISEFSTNIYDRYIKLFPPSEQREWNKIDTSYNDGIEYFYKIILYNKIIGFFMLEKINDKYPYYLDYFAIYEEYQNKGYGSMALKYLLDKIVLDKGLICEIEKIDKNNIITKRRFDFYKKLGFIKIESEYLLYNVFYNPVVYLKDKDIEKDRIDKIFFDYYRINVGETELNRNCKIIN